jgi:predicted metal-dependent HD superfamily phosphohydrolase
LAILGSAAEVYARYEQAIRQEYEWVEVSVYRTKRGEVLRSFLDRDRIYGTDYFHQRLEGQARKNLEWAINRLPEVI